MSREAISASAAPPPAGTNSQAIRAGGTLVFISGQTPRRPDGTRLKDAPFREQARMTMDNLAAIARTAGLSLQDAVKVDVFLRDLADRRLRVNVGKGGDGRAGSQRVGRTRR